MGQKTGKCICGDVTFTVTPASNEVGVCHCGICRKNNAGPFFAVDCADSLNFTNDEKLSVYASSQWAERGFCATCGTSIFWRMKDKKTNIVAVDTLDDMETLVLDHEVFIDEKPDYYSFAQNSKQLTGQQVMEMFSGGSDGGDTAGGNS